jgi:hypothetical protein
VSDDPLRDWAPDRRAALERVQALFSAAAGEDVSLSDELIAERRVAAAAEDDGQHAPRSSPR